MGDVKGGDGRHLLWQSWRGQQQQQQQRPLSAPIHGRDPPPVSRPPAGGTEDRRWQQQPQRRRPKTAASERRSDGARCWSGGRPGGDVDEGKARQTLGCLQARLAKTVEGSSNFVDDIRRLRKAGGLRSERNPAASAARRGGGGGGTADITAAFEPPAVCSVVVVEPLALAKELGVQAIVDRITQAIVCNGRVTRPGGDGGGDAGERGLERSLNETVTDFENLHDRPRRPLSCPSSPAQQRQRQQNHGHPLSPPLPRSPTRSQPPTIGGSNKHKRPKEDVERLRRVVRDAMSSKQPSPSSLSSPNGGFSSEGREHGGTHHPQWSQKHEACLSEMRRKLRETGSPLLRAKDPAVLVGALLRRQGAVIRELDHAVLSLGDTAEALKALVSVSSRLRMAGVSADGLFTRAGVVKAGAGGSLGAAPSNHNNDNGKGVSAVRRCSTKRIHVEINRVLGEVASYREFKSALWACMRGSERGDGSGGSGMEWITVDQLDHALRTCHLTRRALDPQGASHPPLTGKRVALFLEGMERSSERVPQPASAAFVTPSAAGTSSNAVNMLLGKGSSKTQANGVPRRSGRGRPGAASGRSRGRGRRAKMARKRVGKWNDEDRDLAELEMAGVIIQEQQEFVEGYVQERRRYLSRRVSAQRDGHGGFQREEVPSGPGGRWSKKAMEAKKAEFSEAVNRTKVVLKLLEAKSAASSLPQPSGGNGDAAGGAAGVASRNPSGNPSGALGHGSRRRRDPHRSPAKANNDRRKENNASVSDDKRETWDTKKVLRTSTEAYSDRVGQQGGGAIRLNANSKPGAGYGATAGGRGGERARMSAAAQTVQVAFRQRMFHRFVWAQAYLRGPTHAYEVFKRCLPMPRGGGGGGGSFASAATPRHPPPLPPGALADVPSAAVNFGDVWPELPGFCPSFPHHVHAADSIFLGYLRSCTRESADISFSSAATTAEEGTEPGKTPPTASASTGAGVTSPGRPPQQTQQQQQQNPEFAEAFERKYHIRTAAVRGMYVDLRVPFLPGALDAALEDLEQTIAQENAPSVAGRGKSRRRKVDAVGSGEQLASPLCGSGGGTAGGKGRGGQNLHGGRMSFARWYPWWIRNLPFDPASTGCLLKTVRCAKALHASEIANHNAARQLLDRDKPL